MEGSGDRIGQSMTIEADLRIYISMHSFSYASNRIGTVVELQQWLKPFQCNY